MGWLSVLLKKSKQFLIRIGPYGVIIAVGVVIGTGLYFYFNRRQGEAPHEENFRAGASECAICWSAFLHSERVVMLRCRHVFHEVCITRWFRESETCPICRRDYSD